MVHHNGDKDNKKAILWNHEKGDNDPLIEVTDKGWLYSSALAALAQPLNKGRTAQGRFV